MTQEEYIKKNFNEIANLTAVCKSNSSWFDDDFPELEIGKTYHVSHIGVRRSESLIMLTEFGLKEYNADLFTLFEKGEFIDNRYTSDPRFLAPYLRDMYSEWRGAPLPSLAENIEQDRIPSLLRGFEFEHKAKVLLAVESGSRAWGFESINSDWDVRFIYVHKPEWYFKIEEQRDVFEHVYNVVDMVGWELRKSLYLLRRSNPSLLEWLHSPIIYYVNEEFGRRIHEVEKDYFNPVKSMYHYNHVYNKHNERYLQHEGYPMKRFLYYLRGILACKWIESHQSLPPVPFNELLDATVEDRQIRSLIDKLIQIKKGEIESDITLVDNSLVEYARYWADYYNERVGTYRPEQSQASTEALDSILYDMVHSHTYDK